MTLHDFALVKPTNIARAAIRIAAFVVWRVRVAPYTRPCDQFVPGYHHVSFGLFHDVLVTAGVQLYIARIIPELQICEHFVWSSEETYMRR